MGDQKPTDIPRHESLDHEHPTDAGMMDPQGDDAPGTNIYGDETQVKPLEKGKKPGIAEEIPEQPKGR